MTSDTTPTDGPEGRPRIGRRQLLQTGGLAVSLAAVLAACSKAETG